MSVRTTLSLCSVALALVACGGSTPPVDAAPPAAVTDARPAVGDAATGPAAPATADAGDPAPAGESDAPRLLDEEDLLEPWGVDVVTVPRDEVCELVGADHCDELPDEVGVDEVELISWWIAEQRPRRNADIVVLAARAACTMLDTMSWTEMAEIGAASLTALDADGPTFLALVPLLAPGSTTFVCPEHAAAARAEMLEAFCLPGSDEACANTEADWESASAAA